jgi:RNA polymerase sigma-70 factor (ECF subfamily)
MTTMVLNPRAGSAEDAALPSSAHPASGGTHAPLLSAQEWAALRAGEPAAREAFYARYAEPVHRALFAWARGLRPEEAEDLLSEIFLRAFRSVESVRELARLEGWLFGLARNTVMDFLRKRGRVVKELRLEDFSPGVREQLTQSGAEGLARDAAQQAEIAVLVGQVLAELPARYQRALVAKYQEERSLKELGAELSLEPGAAAALLLRARTAFREGFALRTQRQAQGPQ